MILADLCLEKSKNKRVRKNDCNLRSVSQFHLQLHQQYHSSLLHHVYICALRELCAPIGQCLQRRGTCHERQTIMLVIGSLWRVPDAAPVVVHHGALHGIRWSVVMPNTHFHSWCLTSIRLGCHQGDIMSEPCIKAKVFEVGLTGHL